MRTACVALGWAWAAAIAWLSLTPSPLPHSGIEYGDKLGHLAAYGLLMLWFARLYPARRSRVLHAAAFVAMGAGLEFAQGALGYRSFELLDMLANTAGVALGWAVALFLKKPLFP